MCIDFYLLKKSVSFSDKSPRFLSRMYSLLPCSLWICVTFSELKLQGHINLKVSSAHWVIFRIQESHCLLVLWTPVRDWWQCTSLDWMLDSSSAQKTVNMAIAWSMYFSFFIFLSARWKCGINVEEVIMPQSYFRHP